MHVCFPFLVLRFSLVRACAFRCSLCKFTWLSVLLCLEDTVSLEPSTTSDSYNLSPPHPFTFNLSFEGRGLDEDFPFKAECFKVSHSLLWGMLNNTLSYGHGTLTSVVTLYLSCFVVRLPVVQDMQSRWGWVASEPPDAPVFTSSALRL